MKEFPKKLFHKDQLLKEYRLIYILDGNVGSNYAIYFDILAKTRTERVYIDSIDKEDGYWFSDILITYQEYEKHENWKIRTAKSICDGITKNKSED